jgi:hypothetical protein
MRFYQSFKAEMGILGRIRIGALTWDEIVTRLFNAIALTATNKISLMFGDLPPLLSAESILKLCEQYYVSNDEIIPRNERPELLQKGILARIPPP